MFDVIFVSHYGFLSPWFDLFCLFFPFLLVRNNLKLQEQRWVCKPLIGSLTEFFSVVISVLMWLASLSLRTTSSLAEAEQKSCCRLWFCHKLQPLPAHCCQVDCGTPPGQRHGSWHTAQTYKRRNGSHPAEHVGGNKQHDFIISDCNKCFRAATTDQLNL